MEASTLETDLREPEMARYLRNHILDSTGPLLRATWASGLDAVPVGYTTYAANAIERNHRTLKDLMPSCANQQLGQLIVNVCDILNSRYRSDFYNNVHPLISEAPPIL